MPDFKTDIRKSIAELNLPPEQEAEIVEELSQHLEERFEKALSEGASEEEAKQLALEELVQPDSISAQLKRVKIPTRQAPLRSERKKRAIGSPDFGTTFDSVFGCYGSNRDSRLLPS